MKIALSGKPGVGKSTVLRAVLAQCGQRPIVGLYTQPVFEGEQRVGFSLCSQDGRERVFSHVAWSAAPLRFHQYGLQLEPFETLACEILSSATPEALLVIDELGAMETSAERFVDGVKRVFQSNQDVLAVIQQRALDFWLAAIGRANLDQLLIVDQASRDRWPSYLLSWLNPLPRDQ